MRLYAFASSILRFLSAVYYVQAVLIVLLFFSCVAPFLMHPTQSCNPFFHQPKMYHRMLGALILFHAANKPGHTIALQSC
jgi:hypothetical protein